MLWLTFRPCVKAYSYIMMFPSAVLLICYDRYHELPVGFLSIPTQKGESLVCILSGLLYLYRTYIVTGQIGLPTHNSYFQFKFRFEINTDEQIKIIEIFTVVLKHEGDNVLVSPFTSVRIFVVLSYNYKNMSPFDVSFSSMSLILRFTCLVLERLPKYIEFFRQAVLLKAFGFAVNYTQK